MSVLTVRRACGGIENKAFHYACGKLKELVRDALSKAVLEGRATSQGFMIFEAVEALPDPEKFDKLTPEQQEPLRKFIGNAEINFLTADTVKSIEEKFPQLKQEPEP